MALKTKGGQFTAETRHFERVQRELALRYQMRVPTGLSPRAQWMELKPAAVPSWDWWHLYDDDKELWPFIVEIAEEEYDVTTRTDRG